MYIITPYWNSSNQEERRGKRMQKENPSKIGDIITVDPKSGFTFFDKGGKRSNLPITLEREKTGEVFEVKNVEDEESVEVPFEEIPIPKLKLPNGFVTVQSIFGKIDEKKDTVQVQFMKSCLGMLDDIFKNKEQSKEFKESVKRNEKLGIKDILSSLSGEVDRLLVNYAKNPEKVLPAILDRIKLSNYLYIKKVIDIANDPDGHNEDVKTIQFSMNNYPSLLTFITYILDLFDPKTESSPKTIRKEGRRRGIGKNINSDVIGDKRNVEKIGVTQEVLVNIRANIKDINDKVFKWLEYFDRNRAVELVTRPNTTPDSEGNFSTPFKLIGPKGQFFMKQYGTLMTEFGKGGVVFYKMSAQIRKMSGVNVISKDDEEHYKVDMGFSKFLEMLIEAFTSKEGNIFKLDKVRNLYTVPELCILSKVLDGLSKILNEISSMFVNPEYKDVLSKQRLPTPPSAKYMEDFSKSYKYLGYPPDTLEFWEIASNRRSAFDLSKMISKGVGFILPTKGQTGSIFSHFVMVGVVKAVNQIGTTLLSKGAMSISGQLNIFFKLVVDKLSEILRNEKGSPPFLKFIVAIISHTATLTAGFTMKTHFRKFYNWISSNEGNTLMNLSNDYKENERERDEIKLKRKADFDRLESSKARKVVLGQKINEYGTKIDERRPAFQEVAKQIEEGKFDPESDAVKKVYGALKSTTKDPMLAADEEFLPEVKKTLFGSALRLFGGEHYASKYEDNIRKAQVKHSLKFNLPKIREGAIDCDDICKKLRTERDGFVKEVEEIDKTFDKMQLDTEFQQVQNIEETMEDIREQQFPYIKKCNPEMKKNEFLEKDPESIDNDINMCSKKLGRSPESNVGFFNKVANSTSHVGNFLTTSGRPFTLHMIYKQVNKRFPFMKVNKKVAYTIYIYTGIDILSTLMSNVTGAKPTNLIDLLKWGLRRGLNFSGYGSWEIVASVGLTAIMDITFLADSWRIYGDSFTNPSALLKIFWDILFDLGRLIYKPSTATGFIGTVVPAVYENLSLKFRRFARYASVWWNFSSGMALQFQSVWNDQVGSVSDDVFPVLTVDDLSSILGFDKEHYVDLYNLLNPGTNVEFTETLYSMSKLMNLIINPGELNDGTGIIHSMTSEDLVRSDVEGIEKIVTHDQLVREGMEFVKEPEEKFVISSGIFGYRKMIGGRGRHKSKNGVKVAKIGKRIVSQNEALRRISNRKIDLVRKLVRINFKIKTLEKSVESRVEKIYKKRDISKLQKLDIERYNIGTELVQLLNYEVVIAWRSVANIPSGEELYLELKLPQISRQKFKKINKKKEKIWVEGSETPMGEQLIKLPVDSFEELTIQTDDFHLKSDRNDYKNEIYKRLIEKWNTMNVKSLTIHDWDWYNRFLQTRLPIDSSIRQKFDRLSKEQFILISEQQDGNLFGFDDDGSEGETLTDFAYFREFFHYYYYSRKSDFTLSRFIQKEYGRWFDESSQLFEQYSDFDCIMREGERRNPVMYENTPGDILVELNRKTRVSGIISISSKLKHENGGGKMMEFFFEKIRELLSSSKYIIRVDIGDTFESVITENLSSFYGYYRSVDEALDYVERTYESVMMTNKIMDIIRVEYIPSSSDTTTSYFVSFIVVRSRIFPFRKIKVVTMRNFDSKTIPLVTLSLRIIGKLLKMKEYNKFFEFVKELHPKVLMETLSYSEITRVMKGLLSQYVKNMLFGNLLLSSSNLDIRNRALHYVEELSYVTLLLTIANSYQFKKTSSNIDMNTVIYNVIVNRLIPNTIRKRSKVSPGGKKVIGMNNIHDVFYCMFSLSRDPLGTIKNLGWAERNYNFVHTLQLVEDPFISSMFCSSLIIAMNPKIVSSEGVPKNMREESDWYDSVWGESRISSKKEEREESMIISSELLMTSVDQILSYHVPDDIKLFNLALTVPGKKEMLNEMERCEVIKHSVFPEKMSRFTWINEHLMNCRLTILKFLGLDDDNEEIE